MPECSPHRPRLSVAMIVRNAQDTIQVTLDCVSSMADEILVVDTGSTDRTLDIVRQADATLVQAPWTDDFSAARNLCLSHVQGEWVLWLDAGEHLRGDDSRQLGEFVRQRADASRAYLMLVKIPPLPGSISGEQAARVRLIPNRPGLRFDGRIRESLFPSLDSLGLSVEGLPWRICRDSQADEPQQRRAKAQRDLRIAEMEISEIGAVPRLLNCRGDALQVLGDVVGAAECFSRALELAEPGSPEMLEAYYGLLTALDGTDASREQQLSVCLQALESFPTDAQLLCAMGGYLQSQGRLDLACRAYQTAYQHGQVNPQTWHLDALMDIAAVCYSLALQLQNNEPLAVKSLEEALAAHPRSVRIRRHLTGLYIKQCRRDKALETADQLPQPEVHREALHSAIRGACLANQNNWPAAKAYLQAAFRSGCRDPICLRWYALTLLTVGDNVTASSVIEQWRKVDPASCEVQHYLQRTAACPAQGVSSARPVRIDPRQQAPAPVEQAARAVKGLASGPPAPV